MAYCAGKRMSCTFSFCFVINDYVGRQHERSKGLSDMPALNNLACISPLAEVNHAFMHHEQYSWFSGCKK